MKQWLRKRYLLMAAGTAALCGVVLSGCSLGYYSQAIGGHLRLMSAREPIADVLASEDTDAETKEKLQTLIEARQFAIDELGLPENDSYSTYAATGRDAVTWNVVAVPEFSMSPRLWCFPVAGCVSYRGYFDKARADSYAADLENDGFDVTVGGASAYSTLGWFDDPVLDTMLRGGDIRFVATLFHELAHQVLYIQDDSSFNEAFATFVEQEGFRIWLRSRDEESRIEAYDTILQRSSDFSELLNATRGELDKVFAEEGLEEAERRTKKAQVFADMQTNYAALKTSWNEYAGYDRWFSRDLNNAHLLGVSTYRRLVPAFSAMYKEAGSDLPKFYTLATEISKLPTEERNERMASYGLQALN